MHLPAGIVVVLIVVGVLALAALRAWWWVRKERVLRRVGLDLHVPEENGDERGVSRDG